MVEAALGNMVWENRLHLLLAVDHFLAYPTQIGIQQDYQHECVLGT